MKNIRLWNDGNWSLLQDFDRLHGTMNQLFTDVGRNYREKSSDFSASEFVPACDIQETAGHHVMHFDLPGIKQEDIQIEMNNNQLIISGERKTDNHYEDSNVQRVERSFGRFQRSFTLPQNVDAQKIEANYENGVLTLVLPKTEEAKPRQIKINEGKTNILDRVFGKKAELKVSGDSTKN